ncbi:mycofactocin precursor MftA [Streptomyces sp. NPDC052701]
MNEPNSSGTETNSDDESTPSAAATDESPLAVDELIEEVSIDGMCGVY